MKWRSWLVGVLIVAAAIMLWRYLLALIVFVALVSATVYGANKWRAWRAVQRFRAAWHPAGKDLLLVYSNSPHWQRYVEEMWLPKWGHRAVVLNWSERGAWNRRRPEVALFHICAGSRDFNPLGIVVPAGPDRVRIVRFWRAFRDHKHGNARALRIAEAELERSLEAAGPGGPAGIR